MKRGDFFPARPRAVSLARPADPIEPAGDSDFIECPRCCSAPLRLVVNEVKPGPDDDDREDRLYLATYTCVCGWSSTRDAVVERLLRQHRQLETRFEEFAMAALRKLLKCATRKCDGTRDPSLDGLRMLAELGATITTEK